MKNFRVFLLLILGIGFVFLAEPYSSVNAQSAENLANSSDAIAVRILPNPNHFSIARWYESQGFSGAPQALTVDGYEAVRDGRTVYVNATNLVGKDIYTNVYLISYNQSSAEKTIDILGQIVNHWKFNSNIVESTNPVPSCSISNKNCGTDSDCGAEEKCSTSGISSSSCILKAPKNCVVDTECPANFFCSSLKAKIIRDAKRIGQLDELKNALYSYYKDNKSHYPNLSAGTYLPNYSISVWPSWTQNLLSNLSISTSYLDPINRLGACPGYDSKTCWNDLQNKFVNTPTQNYLSLPAGSYAIVYKSDSNGSNYNLCATMESREPSLGYRFMPSDPTSSACIVDTGITTGGHASNTAPILVDVALSGEAGKEFIGFINVRDYENNPLTWTLDTSGAVWKNWVNGYDNNVAPILKDSNIATQKRVYASQAGDPGSYNLGIKVDDGQGGILSTTTVIKIGNSAPLIEAEEGEYLLSSYNPFSYSFTFSDDNLENATSSYSIVKTSGVFDIWGEAKTETIEAAGINKYKVTHSGYLSSTTHEFANNLDFTYRITVTDKYKVASTKDIKIKLIVERPTLTFNCPPTARLEQDYKCFLGSAYSATRKFLNYIAIGPLPDYLELKKSTSSDFFITGRAANKTGSFKNEIQVSDEYHAFATSSFAIKINNFCGDGKIQKPNDEKQGGYYNDGYEECDGLDGVTSVVTSSSRTLQYSCSTKIGYKIPEVITSKDYCTYLSAAEGGGYCGDGYCSAKDFYGNPLETSCNCEKDCGPAISCVNTNVCTYTYSDWSICDSSNTQSRTVASATPSGCTGTPVTSQACTYDPVTYCRVQADCPAGFDCRSYTDPTLYYCTGWAGQHSCTIPVSGVNCYNITDKNSSFSSCKTACNGLRAVTINGVPNSGLCNWSVQNGRCFKSDACVYTYSNWGACQNNIQTRTVVSSTPAACNGTPYLSQPCVDSCNDNSDCVSGNCQGLDASCQPTNSSYTCPFQNRSECSGNVNGNCDWFVNTPGTCQQLNDPCSYTYSDWSACGSDNTLHRTVISATPNGCSGIPYISQPCSNQCNFTYSDWGACQSSGDRTRTVISSSPSGCVGTPVISEACSDVTLPCSDNYDCSSGYCYNLRATCERPGVYSSDNSCGHSDKGSCENAGCNWIVTARGACQ